MRWMLRAAVALGVLGSIPALAQPSNNSALELTCKALGVFSTDPPEVEVEISARHDGPVKLSDTGTLSVLRTRQPVDVLAVGIGFQLLNEGDVLVLMPNESKKRRFQVQEHRRTFGELVSRGASSVDLILHDEARTAAYRCPLQGLDPKTLAQAS